MRIVYVIEKMSGIGGMERIITDKMNYLVNHTGHEVVLLLLWHILLMKLEMLKQYHVH